MAADGERPRRVELRSTVATLIVVATALVTVLSACVPVVAIPIHFEVEPALAGHARVSRDLQAVARLARLSDFISNTTTQADCERAFLMAASACPGISTGIAAPGNTSVALPEPALTAECVATEIKLAMCGIVHNVVATRLQHESNGTANATVAYLCLKAKAVRDTLVRRSQAAAACNPPCDKGRCIRLANGTSACVCNAGYGGSRCQTPLASTCAAATLPGSGNSSQPLCSGHGVCAAGVGCVCNGGWSGARCENRVCEPACSSHGQCVPSNGTSPAVCKCAAGYTGASCGVRSADLADSNQSPIVRTALKSNASDVCVGLNVSAVAVEAARLCGWNGLYPIDNCPSVACAQAVLLLMRCRPSPSVAATLAPFGFALAKETCGQVSPLLRRCAARIQSAIADRDGDSINTRDLTQHAPSPLDGDALFTAMLSQKCTPGAAAGWPSRVCNALSALPPRSCDDVCGSPSAALMQSMATTNGTAGVLTACSTDVATSAYCAIRNAFVDPRIGRPYRCARAKIARALVVSVASACPRCVHGSCARNATGGYMCVCAPGYNGTLCATPASAACSVAGSSMLCSDHGLCTATGCLCNSGWTGARCEKRVCEPACSSHGQCVPSNGTSPAVCKCAAGYVGVTCSARSSDIIDSIPSAIVRTALKSNASDVCAGLNVTVLAMETALLCGWGSDFRAVPQLQPPTVPCAAGLYLFGRCRHAAEQWPAIPAVPVIRALLARSVCFSQLLSASLAAIGKATSATELALAGPADSQASAAYDYEKKTSDILTMCGVDVHALPSTWAAQFRAPADRARECVSAMLDSIDRLSHLFPNAPAGSLTRRRRCNALQAVRNITAARLAMSPGLCPQHVHCGTGSCVPVATGWKCLCPEGYYGDDCSVRRDACFSQPAPVFGTFGSVTFSFPTLVSAPACSGVGRCDNATATCLGCPVGTNGTSCAVAACPNNCASRGVCKVIDGRGKCFCPVGFVGDDCGTPATECSSASGLSMVTANCTAADDALRTVCLFSPTATTTEILAAAKQFSLPPTAACTLAVQRWASCRLSTLSNRTKTAAAPLAFTCRQSSAVASLARAITSAASEACMASSSAVAARARSTCAIAQTNASVACAPVATYTNATLGNATYGNQPVAVLAACQAALKEAHKSCGPMCGTAPFVRAFRAHVGWRARVFASTRKVATSSATASAASKTTAAPSVTAGSTTAASKAASPSSSPSATVASKTVAASTVATAMGSATSKAAGASSTATWSASATTATKTTVSASSKPTASASASKTATASTKTTAAASSKTPSVASTATASATASKKATASSATTAAAQTTSKATTATSVTSAKASASTSAKASATSKATTATSASTTAKVSPATSAQASGTAAAATTTVITASASGQATQAASSTPGGLATASTAAQSPTPTSGAMCPSVGGRFVTMPQVLPATVGMCGGAAVVSGSLSRTVLDGKASFSVSVGFAASRVGGVLLALSGNGTDGLSLGLTGTGNLVATANFGAGEVRAVITGPFHDNVFRNVTLTASNGGVSLAVGRKTAQSPRMSETTMDGITRVDVRFSGCLSLYGINGVTPANIALTNWVGASDKCCGCNNTVAAPRNVTGACPANDHAYAGTPSTMSPTVGMCAGGSVAAQTPAFLDNRKSFAISLKLRSRALNGTVLSLTGKAADKVVLTLENGNLVLLVDYGSGPLSARLQGRFDDDVERTVNITSTNGRATVMVGRSIASTATATAASIEGINRLLVSLDGCVTINNLDTVALTSLNVTQWVGASTTCCTCASQCAPDATAPELLPEVVSVCDGGRVAATANAQTLKAEMTLTLRFATTDSNGVLFAYNSTDNSRWVQVQHINGRVVASALFDPRAARVVASVGGALTDDGAEHTVTVVIGSGSLAVSVNNGVAVSSGVSTTGTMLQNLRSAAITIRGCVQIVAVGGLRASDFAVVAYSKASAYTCAAL